MNELRLNPLNDNDIEKLNERIEQVVKDEYPYATDEMYAAIEKMEIDYVCGKMINMTILFGRSCGVNKENNWQKEVTLPLISDNPEFIAGQFNQAIIDKDS